MIAGAWKYLEANILPYVIDWIFIFLLGILMAGLSFGLDYVISKILSGKEQCSSVILRGVLSYI